MDEVVVQTIYNRSADFRTKAITWGDKPMPRPEQFEIVFDAPGPVYFAEQVVTGNVILQITEPVNLKGVKMRFKGECSIHFTDKKKILRRKKNKPKQIPPEKLELKEKKKVNNYPKNSRIWPTQPNGNGVGITNPSYISELEKVDWSIANGNTLESPIKNGVHIAPNRRKLSAKVSKEKRRPLSAAFEPGYIDGPTQHYQAIETYFDVEFYIYGHKYQREEKELLPAGLHTFPFAFNLPPNLPPSFTSEKGIIRYMVAAVLDRANAANLVRKAGFNVHALLDLNLNSHAGSTANHSKAVNPCGLCWETGPITLSISLPRQGYVPGEIINVYAEIDNISGKKTKRTKLTLSQILTYIMPNKVKTFVEDRKVKEIVRGALAPGDTDFWEDVHIRIPPLAPNNLHLTCRLIKLDYKLEMIVELPRPWKDLKVEIPLILGSVPLRSEFHSFLPCLDSTLNTNPPLPGIKYSDFPNYGFGKCIFDNETLEGQYERLTGDKEFMGPAYVEETPFTTTYLVYNTGNNISRSTTTTSTGTNLMDCKDS